MSKTKTITPLLFEKDDAERLSVEIDLESGLRVHHHSDTMGEGIIAICRSKDDIDTFIDVAQTVLGKAPLGVAYCPDFECFAYPDALWFSLTVL